MKHIITTSIKAIIFTAAFIISLYIFLPWREAGTFALSMAADRLQRMGMRLSYSDVSGENGGFTVSNLALSGMVNISAGSVTIKPDIASSLLSIAPVCDITFKGAGARLGSAMNFGSGGFLLTAGREITLENLHTDGEISLDGYIAVSPSNMRITRANARFDVPEEMSRNMSLLRNFLPLVQEGDKWYLRRN